MELKATTAREITKESVTEAETLVVNGVKASKCPSVPSTWIGRLNLRSFSDVCGHDFKCLR